MIFNNLMTLKLNNLIINHNLNYIRNFTKKFIYIDSTIILIMKGHNKQFNKYLDYEFNDYYLEVLFI